MNIIDDDAINYNSNSNNGDDYGNKNDEDNDNNINKHNNTDNDNNTINDNHIEKTISKTRTTAMTTIITITNE